MASALVQARVGERRANAGRLLFEAARTYPERVAVIFHRRQWSYRELNDRVNALALGLTRLGLQAGDRVVLWLNNCPPFIETMFACWKAGLVVVPVNARLTPAEVAFQVTDCAASALVYGAEFSAGAAQVPAAHKISIGGGRDLPYEDLAGRAGADCRVRQDLPGRSRSSRRARSPTMGPRDAQDGRCCSTSIRL